MRACFPILFPAMLIVCCLDAPLRGQDKPSRQLQYEVVYVDGRTIEGARIHKDHFLAHGRSRAHLDAQLIFSPDKKVRRIRNRTRKIRAEGPYVEFNNGDILPGQVVRVRVANPGRNLPDYLHVRLSGPLTNYAGRTEALIRVRADHVARIVTRMRQNRSGQAGYVRLKSGTSYTVRSIRWRPDEVQALTAVGVQAIPIHKVEQLYQPAKERVRRTQQGPIGASGQRVILAAVNGARFTASEDRLVRHAKSSTAVQPVWALDAIVLRPENIAEVVFLRPHEIPLSALPAEVLTEKNFFGRWNWVRNRSARGGRLDSGDQNSTIGIGMHAHSAMAFYLPPGAENFSCWLGLDRAVGDGGCAIASVYLSDLQGKPAWQSDFLRGGQPAVRVGPISVKNQERLILVADFGHKGRPQGADPFDIRDEVDWIDTIIEVESSESSAPELERVLPLLKGWTLSEQDRARLTPTYTWNPREGRWASTLRLPVPAATAADDQAEPMLLGKPGVHYEYYEIERGAVLPDFEKLTPKSSGTHPDISLSIPKVRPSYLALRFKSTLVVPRDGFYEFYLKSDDGSRMFINGELVISNDGLHYAKEIMGRAALRKGGVPIQVEYFNGASARHLSLDWMGPGTPRQTIPPESFDLAKTAPIKGLSPGADDAAIDPVILNRTLVVTPANAWLRMTAGKSEDGIGDYEFEVRVDGKLTAATTSQQVHTRDLEPMQLIGGVWSLADHVGRKVNLQIAIKPLGYPGRQIPALYMNRLELGEEPDVISETIARIRDRFDDIEVSLPRKGYLKKGQPVGVGWVNLLEKADDWAFEKNHWTLTGGVLHGESKGGNSHYAWTKKHHDDFELHVVVRIRGRTANSGVVLRLRPQSHSEVLGYQVDVGPAVWGFLRIEGASRELQRFPVAQADKIVQKASWNHYYIVAEGHRIQAWLNGVKTIDKVHDKGFLNGAIGMQLYRDRHTVLDVKTLIVRELK